MKEKMTLGFNTAGTEEYFESMLRKAMLERTTTTFGYLEIGVAEGTTLISVADWLKQNIACDWQAWGVDIVDGPFFDCKRFLKRSLAHEVSIIFNGRKQPFIDGLFANAIKVHLLKGERRVMVSPKDINFALIDGCHGAPCVEADFLAIEQGIAHGGIVAFHDAGVWDQGIHFQKHCGMPISVQKALVNLGLFGGKNNDGYTFNELTDSERPGWKFIGSVDGDKSPGNLEDNGHGFAFFQKLNGEKEVFTEQFSGERR